MPDDFMCELQSDELIFEDWDEELDDFGYEILASTEKELPHSPDDSWQVV